MKIYEFFAKSIEKNVDYWYDINVKSCDKFFM